MDMKQRAGSSRGGSRPLMFSRQLVRELTIQSPATGVRGPNRKKEEGNSMSCIDSNYHIARLRGIFALFALALATGIAHGQNLTTPATPTIITPPDGHSLFLGAPAVGTQGYICLPTSTGA